VFFDSIHLASNQDIFERLHATSSPFREALPLPSHFDGTEKSLLPCTSQISDAHFTSRRRSSSWTRCHGSQEQRPGMRIDPTTTCHTEMMAPNSSQSSHTMQFLYEHFYRFCSLVCSNIPTTTKKKRRKRCQRSTSGFFGPFILWILISTLSLLTTSTTAIGKDFL